VKTIEIFVPWILTVPWKSTRVVSGVFLMKDLRNESNRRVSR